MSQLFQKRIEGRNFNFTPIEFSDQSCYLVDVKDEEGTRWEFRIFHTADDALKIRGENMPDWILKLEIQLVEAINNHE